MFQAVRLQNFKPFEDMTVRLGAANVLVGVNNAGKSTVLDAFRALSGRLRVAHQRRASVGEPDRQGFHVGYNIPTSLLPITTKNVHTDYREENAILTFTLQNRRVMRIVFPADGGCRLLLAAGLHEVSTLREFGVLYPASVNIIQTPGPFEEEEDYPTDEYFSQAWQSRRSQRYSRNIWSRQSATSFDQLNEKIQITWPGMKLLKPEREGYGPTRLVMFCEDGHRLREVYWVGFGFQIWVQFLSHLLLLGPRALLVVDEPDIYLHPELQRKAYAYWWNAEVSSS